MQSGCRQAVDGHVRHTQLEISTIDKILDSRKFFREVREIHAGDRIGDFVMLVQRTEIIQGTKVGENKELLLIKIECAVAAVSESFDAFQQGTITVNHDRYLLQTL